MHAFHCVSLYGKMATIQVKRKKKKSYQKKKTHQSKTWVKKSETKIHREEHQEGQIKSGKAGRPRKCYQYANNACDSTPMEPSSIREIMTRKDKLLWLDAMKAEYSSLMENETWTLMNRSSNEKVLTNRWIFKVKQNQDGTVKRYKVRLVAGGHRQTKGVDYEEVFVPIARFDSTFATRRIGGE